MNQAFIRDSIGSKVLHFTVDMTPDEFLSIQAEHRKIFMLMLRQYEPETRKADFTLAPGNGVIFRDTPSNCVFVMELNSEKIKGAITKRIWEKLKLIGEIDSDSDAASAQEDLIDEYIKGLQFALKVIESYEQTKEVQGE